MFWTFEERQDLLCRFFQLVSKEMKNDNFNFPLRTYQRGCNLYNNRRIGVLLEAVSGTREFFNLKCIHAEKWGRSKDAVHIQLRRLLGITGH